MTYDPRYPVVIGLAGQACTGKTVAGHALAPIASVELADDAYKYGLQWDHLFFAMPLYRMATTRQKIQGERAFDRMFYEMHDTMLELFGRSPIFGALSYDDLTDLVRHLVRDLPCEPYGKKARSFMQQAGSLCREYDKDVFVRWMQRKIHDDFRRWTTEHPESQLKRSYAITDVRFENEAKMIRNQPNGVLIKLITDRQTQIDRSIARDGHWMNAQELAHESETEILTIPDTAFDAVLDTSPLTIQEEVDCILTIIQSSIVKTEINA